MSLCTALQRICLRPTLPCTNASTCSAPRCRVFWLISPAWSDALHSLKVLLSARSHLLQCLIVLATRSAAPLTALRRLRAQPLHLRWHRTVLRPVMLSWSSGFSKSTAAGRVSALCTFAIRTQAWYPLQRCLGSLHRRALALSSCAALLGLAAKYLREFAQHCTAAQTDIGLFPKEIGMSLLQIP